MIQKNFNNLFKLFITYIIAGFFLSIPTYGFSDELNSEPEKVSVGVYLMTVGKFNYTNQTFDSNFYIWWLSNNPNYHPEKSIEITNADNFKIVWSTHDKIRNQFRTLSRYSVTANQNWNLQYFPFDRQKLVISLEDILLDSSKIDFLANAPGTMINPNIIIDGWTINHFHLEKVEHLYKTNFGDLNTKQSIYSRINIVLDIKRNGWDYFFVYFIGFFLSAFLCILTFFISFNKLNERNALSVGAVFSAIGNKYYINSTLPISTSGLSLTDTIVICTFILILIAIFNNVVTHILAVNNRHNLAVKVDTIILIISSFSYFSVISWVIYTAIHS